MNAESYLRKQGWKGSGHSLDSTGRGIKKPLLIAHKQDQLGLGKKKAAWTTDDQWWMRAYDQSLQSIGTGQESTLNQIRTKGVNRGGLYGFFVKGEAIAGTIEDSSASATDASMPPSGASTPPTSASDSEAPAKDVKKFEKKKKRKRQEEDKSSTIKKAKKAIAKVDKKEKTAMRKSTGSSEVQNVPSSKDQDTVARKIAKLSPKKKAACEKRAAAKKQTLNAYMLRRIQKKSAKRATRYGKPPAESLFFTDVKGDATIVQQATTTTPTRPVLGLVEEAVAEIPLNATPTEKPRSTAKPTPHQELVKKGKSGAKKAMDNCGTNSVREKRNLKRERE